MSKDGTLRGGARTGSGPKKKPLTDKINEGKTAMIFEMPEPADLEGVDMPPVKDYMKAEQRDGNELCAEEVYRETWDYLKRMGCAELVNPQMLYQYAMNVARWVQAEENLSKYGPLSKHVTTGAAQSSPFHQQSNAYCKMANVIWNEIFQIVKENSSVEYKGASPQDDVMERLLRARSN